MRKLNKKIKVLFTLVRANILNRFQESLFGPLWVLFNPLLLLAIHWFIFKDFMDEKESGYLIYLCAGILPWYMFKTSLDISVSTLPFKLKALKNFPFKLYLYNISTTLEYYCYYLLLMVLIFTVGGKLTPSFKVLIYSLPAQLIWLSSCCALSNMLSLINVIYRDTKFLVDFVSRLLFLLTPILYHEDAISSLKSVHEINILYWLLKPFYIIYGVVDGVYLMALMKAFFVAMSLIILSVVISKRLEKKVFHYE